MKQKLIYFLSLIFTSRFTKFAYEQLTNPQIKKLRENELSTLEKAEKIDFKFKAFNIKTYLWKGGEKKILLIHGWEGQAGNFSDIIEELILQNYTVYAFDGPSHGFSSKGQTSLLEFTELVGILIRKFKVNKLISHSFGGVATTYALTQNTDLQIEKYVLLTTPDKFIERIDDVAAKVGLSNKIKSNLVQQIKTETGLNVYDLNVSDFVKKINVKKALIIHDKNDRIIPISQSKNVNKNWNASSLIEVEGTGHFRILRNVDVTKTVLEFIA